MTDASTKCLKCERHITNDEIGIYKKMINRGAVNCMCLPCLAEYLKTTEEALKERIEFFRSQGCTLFL